MLVVFPPIFVADTKMIYGYNFVAPLSKAMPSIYLKVTIKTFSKLRFSGFKKFVTMSVFGELQLTQISLNFKTSCCNLKIKCMGANLCVAFLLF